MPNSAENEEIHLSNALQAYISGEFKSIASAAAHFGVSKHKLNNRKHGILSKKGCTPVNKALMIRKKNH